MTYSKTKCDKCGERIIEFAIDIDDLGKFTYICVNCFKKKYGDILK
jgi:formylmethanofuran dehydrogenase subunit E